MTSKEIKALRDRLGWSQERLAQEMGVSFTTVNRWETGKCKPSQLAEAWMRELGDDDAKRNG
jgi:putative transcriptional regulator